MYSFGVVELQIHLHLFIEFGRVVEEEVDVVVDKLFLNSAVEAFAVSIHFRSLRICVVVSDLVLREQRAKVQFEFTAIVGQHVLDLVRKHFHDEEEEVGEGLRRVRLGGDGECRSAVDVDGGQDIHPATVSLLLDGVECHDVSWVLWNQILWLSKDFLAIGTLHLAEVRYFLWECPETSHVDDQSFNRRRFGASLDAKSVTKIEKQRMQLFSSKIRMRFRASQSSQLFEDTEIPDPSSFLLRRPFAGIQGI